MRVSIASPLMQIRAFGRMPICDMKGALIPGPSLRPIALRSLKAGALTKAVENALSQRCVVTIEMMAAGGANDLRLSLPNSTSKSPLWRAICSIHSAAWAAKRLGLTLPITMASFGLLMAILLQDARDCASQMKMDANGGDR